MSNILKSQKKKYSSPEIERLEFLIQDIITTSNQGSSDGGEDDEDRDNSGWT